MYIHIYIYMFILPFQNLRKKNKNDNFCILNKFVFCKSNFIAIFTFSLYFFSIFTCIGIEINRRKTRGGEKSGRKS